MKKYPQLLLLVILFFGCGKKNAITNSINYVAPYTPSFIINGLAGITLVNNYSTYHTSTLSLEYKNSGQENVTLSLSGLPPGLAIDTANWQSSGIPTFSTSFTVFDTLGEGAMPGTYPFTITARTAAGVAKSYTIDIKVLPMPTEFLGAYDSCKLSTSASKFKDSIYLDGTTRNKVWFTNFCNTGARAYGLLSSSGRLTIPAQVIGSGTYSGAGTVNVYGHLFNLSLTTGSSSFTVFMR